jgi:tetratricopeptide (TPR) repeat protein
MIKQLFFACALTLLCAISLTAQTGTTASGVKYTILKEGTGPTPKMGQEITLEIEAYNSEGKVVFSTRELKVPYHEVLGQETDAESKAHDEVLLNIKKGSIYREEFPKSLLPKDNPATREPGDYAVTQIELVEVMEARPSCTNHLLEIAEKSGVAAAETEFKALQKSNKTGCVFNEWDMNRAGYKALEAKKTDLAVALFTMNTQLFPKSANTYDSLADALAAKGDKVNAKANYQKAAQMDPMFKASLDKMNKL